MLVQIIIVLVCAVACYRSLARMSDKDAPESRTRLLWRKRFGLDTTTPATTDKKEA